MKQNKSILSHIYRKIFITSALTSFSLLGAGFIDSVVISRYYGRAAIAAAGLAYPFYYLTGIIYGCIGTGLKSMISKRISLAKTNEVNNIFSQSIILSLLLSIPLLLLFILFSNNIAYIFGARGNSLELLSLTSSYLKGLSFGIPALILNVVISIALQFDNGSNRVRIAHIVSMIVDIVLDILFVSLNKDLFMIALASSISAYSGLFILLLHFFNSKSELKFSFTKLNINDIKDIIYLGSDRVVSRILFFIRPLIINPIAIYFGGTTTMAILSIRNSFINFLAIPGYGISDGVSICADLSYNLQSKQEIKETGVLAHNYTALFTLIPCILIIIFVRPISIFLLKEIDDISLKLLMFALVMGVIKLYSETLLTARLSYLQAIRQIRKAHILQFISNFLIVIISVIICGLLFKNYGVMSSFTISDITVMFLIYLYYAYKKKDFRVSTQDYLLLDNNFNHNQETIELDIYDKKDCIKVSNEVKQLCIRHNASIEQINKGELCAEEGSNLLLEIASKSSKYFDNNVIVKLNASYLNDKLRLHYRFYDKNISLIKEIHNLKQNNILEETLSEKILSNLSTELKTYKTVDIENLYIVI